MADLGTPGSIADTSVNGSSKIGGAPKDKACPFCGQQFTSSSLGRHLDLFIKPKNPKPADGIHIVEEIRKLRGNITRRQPRGSTDRREGSTPTGTPGVNGRRSADAESIRGGRSPSARADSIGPSNLIACGKPRVIFNRASWEATGVMNNIPAAKGVETKSWTGESKDERHREGRSRSVSRQMQAKSNHDQKQKLTEALDNSRAAQLALRELLGSLRAAKHRIEGPNIFDYDPFSLDFPALCLHCLPPPPTLHASTPIPHSQSWSISSPSEPQYIALQTHFSTVFRNHRNAIAIATTTPKDDFSYPPLPDDSFSQEDPASQGIRAAAEAKTLESRLGSHLVDVFRAWTALSPQRRSEIWILEMARGVGRKSLELEKVKKEKDFLLQTNAHLKLQNDELSRLQQPREFRIVPPQTIPFAPELMSAIAEVGLNPDPGTRTVGFTLMDRSVHLDTVIDRVIGRWKGVVSEARGDGMTQQRSLDGEPLLSPQDNRHLASGQRCPPPSSPLAAESNGNPRFDHAKATTTAYEGISIESDQDVDADADADMEEDDSYGRDHTSIGHTSQNAESMRASIEISRIGTKNKGNNNVNGVSSMGMEGIETVQGYVRIGA